MEGIQAELSKGRQGHLVKLEAKLRREMDEVLMMKRCYGFKYREWTLYAMVIGIPGISTF